MPGGGAHLSDLPRLRRMLGGPEFAWLRERLRRRVASGRPLTGLVSLREPTEAEREALDALLGRRPGRGSASVRLEALEAVLTGSGACRSLAEAVEALSGPVATERSRRAALALEWAHVLEGCPVEPGLVRRLSGNSPAVGRQLLEGLSAVLARLPADGIPLGELAAQVAGNGHALDRGSPLGTLALRWIGGSAGWREAWASVGVLCDELSAPVLVLNLPSSGTGLVDHVLQGHRAAGEPCRLTLRQLLRHAPALMPCRASVCENPTVVAAAAYRLGPRCAPLVCVDGQPKPAARRLLEGLRQAGASLRYHGDFDWAGVGIANRVLGWGAEPWRMSAADYLAAPAGGPGLEGPPVAASWDPDLAPAMEARGTAVHEEAVLEALLQDLDCEP